MAEFVGGNVENFANMMNEKANELDLKNTHFVTPHGLDETEHYTTAYELAKITNYALKNKKMILKGIRGTVLLTEITEDVLMLLMIGELIHIGKYTSFGFGRFHLKFVDL